VYGGVDPSSGTASLMELARSLGRMATSGVRPKRTIVFANWDAEEFTLTSSTEWGEQYADDLSRHAVAYLNVDSSASGRSFGAAAVPALNRVILDVADVVIDPETGRSIAAAFAPTARATSALPGAAGASLVNNRLGSGSDYTVFLNFLGIPVADMSFTGPYGVYHSIYDDHLWVSKFGDPGFRYHAAMTQVWGLIALRLANADVVPLDYTAYAKAIREFVDEAAGGAAASDRAAFDPLKRAVDRFDSAAHGIEARRSSVLGSTTANVSATVALDRALIAAERAFLDPSGIPGRPWYRHLIYAPKPTYAAEMLPGITEALEGSDHATLTEQIRRLAAALDRASDILTR
jgi:N-acetylated-alpha-linked acidic dipeptidase